MYYDAVEGILKQLSSDTTKSNKRANLLLELKDLDPTGVIQKYIQEGGPRPDLSATIGKRR